MGDGGLPASPEMPLRPESALLSWPSARTFMRFDALTLFPEMFDLALTGVTGRAFRDLGHGLAAQAQGTIRSRYIGYVALGCAIQGETDHYDFICGECMRGLSDLSVGHQLALGNGVLTVHNEAQALARSDPARKNFGGQAARACLRMIALKQELKL